MENWTKNLEIWNIFTFKCMICQKFKANYLNRIIGIENSDRWVIWKENTIESSYEIVEFYLNNVKIWNFPIPGNVFQKKTLWLLHKQ